MESGEDRPIGSSEGREHLFDRGLSPGEHPARRTPALGGEMEGDRALVGADAALDQPGPARRSTSRTAPECVRTRTAYFPP